VGTSAQSSLPRSVWSAVTCHRFEKVCCHRFELFRVPSWPALPVFISGIRPISGWSRVAGRGSIPISIFLPFSKVRVSLGFHHSCFGLAAHLPQLQLVPPPRDADKLRFASRLFAPALRPVRRSFFRAKGEVRPCRTEEGDSRSNSASSLHASTLAAPAVPRLRDSHAPRSLPLLSSRMTAETNSLRSRSILWLCRAISMVVPRVRVSNGLGRYP
jgi:hypothetical protein